MMKWLSYLALAAVIFFSWQSFSTLNQQIQAKEAEKNHCIDFNEIEKLEQVKNDIADLHGSKTMRGLILALSASILAGLFVVLQILPAVAHRMTHAIYDSAEMVEKDPMHDARSLLAQGDYEGAIEAFKLAATADPMNRLPWVEIVKIYKENLNDPDRAIDTLRYALESQSWEVNDAAYFMFRLAELYDTVKNDRESAVSIMQQVASAFKGTRHSANATHKLHEWGADHLATQEMAVIERQAPTPPPFDSH